MASKEEPTVINVIKWSKLYFGGSDFQDGANRVNVSDDDINLNLLKLKVKPGTMKWTKQNQPSGGEGLPRKVNITKSSGDNAQVFGRVKATHESEHIGMVTLQQGIVKGLNKMLKLPLHDNNLIKFFGDCIEIDPSKPVFEIHRNKIKLDVALEQQVGPRGASAAVEAKENEYSGTFTCTVVMKGNVTAAVGKAGQNTISGIIGALQRRPQSDHDLGACRIVDTKTVEFIMKGEAEFRWQPQYELEWSDK